MNKDGVSIIIPVYNVALYLEDCIESILQQNFQNYEIICINDSSTDGSGVILQRYASKYSYIKVITHEQNQGLSVARNTGLKYASGKYVWFVDSDDMIIPDALNELYYIAEKENIDIIYFDMLRTGEGEYRKEPKIYTCLSEDINVYSGREMFCQFIDNNQLKFQVCRQFIRRGFLKEYHIEFYKGILHEDELFSFRCAMNVKRTLNVNEEYYIYRQRNGSIMHNMDHRRGESLFVVLVQIMAAWVSQNFTDRENQAIAKYYKDLYHSYQYYQCFGDQSIHLEVGGIPEKTLFSLVTAEDKNDYLSLNENQWEKIDEKDKVIVFGAGWAAKFIVNMLKKRNVEIDRIAVSDVTSNPPKFCGIWVDSIENIAKTMKEAVVIIGVTEKYHKEILENLKRLEFETIVIPEDRRTMK